MGDNARLTTMITGISNSSALLSHAAWSRTKSISWSWVLGWPWKNDSDSDRGLPYPCPPNFCSRWSKAAKYSQIYACMKFAAIEACDGRDNIRHARPTMHSSDSGFAAARHALPLGQYEIIPLGDSKSCSNRLCNKRKLYSPQEIMCCESYCDHIVGVDLCKPLKRIALSRQQTTI